MGIFFFYLVIVGFCVRSWVLYEELEFRGRKLVLLEGDVEFGI